MKTTKVYKDQGPATGSTNGLHRENNFLAAKAISIKEKIDMGAMTLRPRWLLAGVAAWLAIVSLGSATAQVTPFVDEFDGPVLDSSWTKVSPGSHPGINGSGQYVVNGVLNADSGLSRSTSGSGSYVAEASVVLGPFASGGTGGTKSDFKFRFIGASQFVEIVFNSFKDLRVWSSQLGGNLAAPINLASMVDGDTLRLQLNYTSSNGTVDVKYAINSNAWQNLASADGIDSVVPCTSDLVMYKFGNSPSTLPQMRLDHYAVEPLILPPPPDTRPRLSIENLGAASPGTNQFRISWNSLLDKSYTVEGSSNLLGWSKILTNVPATPPTNSAVLETSQPIGFFQVMEEGPLPWPNSDYCVMLSQEIQGKKHAFLAGNGVYYVGGQYALWDFQENETLGLTHPFLNDLRSRGYGMVSNSVTGYGHDLQGWEFYRDTKIAYGTVIIGSTRYANPVPNKMYWRPDRVICEYNVGGVSIREDKFISTNNVACSIITSSSPIQIQFNGQSYVNNARSRVRSSTVSYDNTNNLVHVVEGGTALVQPTEGVDVEGKLMYDGMSTVVSASKNFASTYTAFRDGNGRQQYSFTVPCDSQGVSVCWAMDDDFDDARSRVQSVLQDPAGQLAAKKVYMNDLLNSQVPYFRCSDQQMVNVYYYLWSLYLMYYIDVKQGWEQYPHTQTAVNNFLGMHRFDANFQIKVGAWVKDKDYYAYGNVLTWKALLPYARSGGQLPDNMGQSWFSPYWETAIEHVVGAWDIYRHTGDTNFLNDCYGSYFKPLFWNGAYDIWGAKYDGAECLKKMATETGNAADITHWHQVMEVDGLNAWLNGEWEKDGVTNYFGGLGPAFYPAGTTDRILYWTGMAYMRNSYFPDDWAKRMTAEWAVDSVKGFNGPVPLTLVAMRDFAHVFPDFASAPDVNYFSIIGMYKHHVGTNANVLALRHLKNYNIRWGIPVAPESYDSSFGIWGDQYSNFNAGKILFFLEGMAGLDYSIPDGTFTVADNMPQEWSFMELKVPITRNHVTDWVNVRIDRIPKEGGVLEKTVTVTGNTLATLNIQPWLEERPLLNAPGGYIAQPTGHIDYSFSNVTNKTITIELQY